MNNCEENMVESIIVELYDPENNKSYQLVVSKEDHQRLQHENRNDPSSPSTSIETSTTELSSVSCETLKTKKARLKREKENYYKDKQRRHDEVGEGENRS
ncbi:hypothetical protein FQA39_LY04805 [Lamprigera yunnana]|nr:hypothetical protein FQA39_LY04805 [Lamprigera yunnana]